MPEKPEEIEIRKLLIELLGRIDRLDHAIDFLCRVFRDSPWVAIEAQDQLGRISYRILPAFRSKEEVIRFVDEFPFGGPRAEMPATPWQHLVRRPHPWRRQLFIKGRNLTVRQLVGTMKANRLSAQETADDLDLPFDAVREAIQYAEQNKDLIESDAAYERYLLGHGGFGGAAPSVP